MPLLSPCYLRREDFFAQAEYYNIEIPRREEILEISRRTRNASAKLDLSSSGIPLSVNGNIGSDVELQTAYVLEPSEKAAFSRVLEDLEDLKVKRKDVLTNLDRHTVDASTLYKDQLVMISGTLSLSPISSVGKVLNVAQQLFSSEDLDLSELLSAESASVIESSGESPISTEEHEPREQSGQSLMPRSVEAEARNLLQSVYLRNEIPQIPVLLELEGGRGGSRVFINCSPGGFIGDSSAKVDSVEGAYAVLATVSLLVEDDPTDGFISTEAWTLHGWERTMKTMMRSHLDDIVETLIPSFDDSWQPGDAGYFIKGPALILDAIAIW